MTSNVDHEGRLFIGGEFVEAQARNRYPVVNPADESVVATAADADPEGVSLAAEAFRQLAVAEAGTPYTTTLSHVDAMLEDMSYFNGLIETWPSEQELPPYEILGMRSRHRIRYEAYGPVGAITPWNAPFMTNIWKVGHALATGNAVVLKSAPDTPLTGALIAKVGRDHGHPAGHRQFDQFGRQGHRR